MDVTPRDYDCMRVTGYPEAIASPTARPTACSLPREQIVHQAPPHRSTERARNSGQERKKRFVDLRPPRFLRKKEIGQPLHHRHKRSDQEYPAPGLSRTQTSKQHARRQHYHRRQQQITYFDVHPPLQRSEHQRQQIVKPVTVRFLFWKNLAPSCRHISYFTNKCKTRVHSSCPANPHPPS